VKRVIIVQARMTSTRLPGKVLMDLGGQPMLAQQLRRLKSCARVDEIVVATTTNTSDNPVAELARREDVGWFRGDEHDVLSRYVGAARESGADLVVRVTADCPLIDPDVVDRVIGTLEQGSADTDYASNVKPRTFPRGLDVEVFFMDTLLRFDRYATEPLDREHVTSVVHSSRGARFCTASVVDTSDNSDLRWTVDLPVDYEVVRRLFEGLQMQQQRVAYSQLLAYARAHPEIAALNGAATTWEPGT
jgi:spore coat polysaccharide biosynthesis protein SpsF